MNLRSCLCCLTLWVELLVSRLLNRIQERERGSEGGRETDSVYSNYHQPGTVLGCSILSHCTQSSHGYKLPVFLPVCACRKDRMGNGAAALVQLAGSRSRSV